jgi:hypothetical protein
LARQVVSVPQVASAHLLPPVLVHRLASALRLQLELRRQPRLARHLALVRLVA